MGGPPPGRVEAADRPVDRGVPADRASAGQSQWVGQRSGRPREPGVRSPGRACPGGLPGQAQLLGRFRRRPPRHSPGPRVPRDEPAIGDAQLRVPPTGHPSGGRDRRRRADLRFPGHRGRPEGDFSLGGWRADLAAGIRTLREVPGIEEIWLVGFAAGGTLVHLRRRPKTRRWPGVAALAPPAEFADRGGDPRRLVAQARASGLIRTRGYPPDPGAWARELRAAAAHPSS